MDAGTGRGVLLEAVRERTDDSEALRRMRIGEGVDLMRGIVGLYGLFPLSMLRRPCRLVLALQAERRPMRRYASSWTRVRMLDCRRRVGRLGLAATVKTVDDAIAEAHHAFKAWGNGETAKPSRVAVAEDLQQPVRAWHPLEPSPATGDTRRSGGREPVRGDLSRHRVGRRQPG